MAMVVVATISPWRNTRRLPSAGGSEVEDGGDVLVNEVCGIVIARLRRRSLLSERMKRTNQKETRPR